MEGYIDVALEHGVRFFVTALGNPAWVVERVRPFGGIVYHDVVDRKWAEKALEGGVHGLLCVNNRAGGHAGYRSPEQLVEDLHPLGVPLLCAGGVGNPAGFARALSLGYEGVQMGTRFIATAECDSHDDYKTAILRAKEEDIVLTERITGVPLAVIRTPYVDRIGTKAGPVRAPPPQGADDEALDARLVLRPVVLAAEGGDPEGELDEGRLAGGEERRRDRLGSPRGRGDGGIRGGVPRGGRSLKRRAPPRFRGAGLGSARGARRRPASAVTSAGASAGRS